VRRAGSITLPLVKQYVDEVVTVDEDELAAAILVLLEREKTLAEGAGAAALAALLQKRTSIPQGARTAVLVCGGNIDVTLLSRIIERGLVQDGRWTRLRIHLLDRSGALRDLTKLIADHGVNIVDTLYNRSYYGVNLGETTIDITMETRGRDQLDELLDALSANGYRHSRVL
jgi:threonine dehydratase